MLCNPLFILAAIPIGRKRLFPSFLLFWTKPLFVLLETMATWARRSLVSSWKLVLQSRGLKPVSSLALFFLRGTEASDFFFFFDLLKEENFKRHSSL